MQVHVRSELACDTLTAKWNGNGFHSPGKTILVAIESSPTVSARLRYSALYHSFNSVVFVHRAVAVAKEYPLSKLFSKAELLPFEQEKCINLVCSSCLKHANEMLQGDPRRRLTSERKASTSPLSFINLLIPPLKRQSPSLYMLV